MEYLYFMILSFVFWYIWHFIEYGLNSGSLGRHQFMFVFDCFKEDLSFFMPGYKMARIKFVKNQLPLNLEVHICASDKTWTLKDVTLDDNLTYDDNKLLDCFNSIMFGLKYFIGKHLIILLISTSIVF